MTVEDLIALGGALAIRRRLRGPLPAAPSEEDLGDSPPRGTPGEGADCA